MNILSIALNAHDSNISYTDTDDKIINYINYERKFNFKHAVINLNYLQTFLKRLEKNWDYIIYTDVGHLMVFVDDRNLLIPVKKEFFNIPSFSKKNTKIYNISHNLSHIYSSKFFQDISTDFYGISLDGGGNNCSELITHSNEVLYSNSFNFGKKFRALSNALNIKGEVGEVMGLANYAEDVDKNLQDILYNTYIGEDVKAFNYFLQKELKDVDISKPNKSLNKVHTVHEFLSSKIIELFREYIPLGSNVCYGGGVALNINTNTKLDNLYKLHICPAANDSGLSIGSLNFILNAENFQSKDFKIKNKIHSLEENISDTKLKNLAELLAENKIVAFCYGEDEIGPRALGHRSILMNPSIKNGKDFINKQIKHRQWWRPFGGSIIDTSIIKNYKPSSLDPYMLKQFEFKNEYKEMFESIIHVDNSSRLQIVEKNENDPFYRLIYYFKELTGIPGLLNTSFNLNGFPISSTENYCINTFKCMDNLNYMLIGNTLIQK